MWYITPGLYFLNVDQKLENTHLRMWVKSNMCHSLRNSSLAKITVCSWFWSFQAVSPDKYTYTYVSNHHCAICWTRRVHSSYLRESFSLCIFELVKDDLRRDEGLVFHGKLHCFFEEICRTSGHCRVQCVRHSVYYWTLSLEDVWLYSDLRFSLRASIYSSIRYIHNFWTKIFFSLSSIIFSMYHMFQLTLV